MKILMSHRFFCRPIGVTILMVFVTCGMYRLTSCHWDVCCPRDRMKMMAMEALTVFRSRHSDPCCLLFLLLLLALFRYWNGKQWAEIMSVSSLAHGLPFWILCRNCYCNITTIQLVAFKRLKVWYYQWPQLTKIVVFGNTPPLATSLVSRNDWKRRVIRAIHCFQRWVGDAWNFYSSALFLAFWSFRWEGRWLLHVSAFECGIWLFVCAHVAVGWRGGT